MNMFVFGGGDLGHEVPPKLKGRNESESIPTQLASPKPVDAAKFISVSFAKNVILMDVL